MECLRLPIVHSAFKRDVLNRISLNMGSNAWMRSVMSMRGHGHGSYPPNHTLLGQLGAGCTGSSPSVFGRESKLLWIAVRRVRHGDKTEAIVRMQIKKSSRVLLST